MEKRKMYVIVNQVPFAGITRIRFNGYNLSLL